VNRTAGLIWRRLWNQKNLYRLRDEDEAAELLLEGKGEAGTREGRRSIVVTKVDEAVAVRRDARFKVASFRISNLA